MESKITEEIKKAHRMLEYSQKAKRKALQLKGR
jgi:hypothetical protein